MTPQEIVHELDKHIVGQAKAKRAVAIALRNRWRRQQVAEPLRQEITPKNILMIGPTGVGKTEIARRLAQARRRALHQGRGDQVHRGRLRRPRRRHHRPRPGRDCHQAERASRRRAKCSTRAEDARRGAHPRRAAAAGARRSDSARQPSEAESGTRQKFRKKLREGELDDKEIEIEVAAVQPQMEILAPPGMEELTSQIQGMFQNLGGGAPQAAQAEGPRGDEAADRRGSGASWSTTRT